MDFFAKENTFIAVKHCVKATTACILSPFQAAIEALKHCFSTSFSCFSRRKQEQETTRLRLYRYNTLASSYL